jgi:hypothetical protein
MSIDNTDDIIDSRDVIARIEELEEEELNASADKRLVFLEDEADELAALRKLAAEAEGYAADWHHGETLIRDSYFQEYAQQLADDIGAIDRNASWPTNCIDWDQAARKLQQDYTAVDFDGVTYWVR